MRRNFLVDETGILTQLTCLAALLEEEDLPLFFKLRQVSAWFLSCFSARGGEDLFLLC